MQEFNARFKYGEKYRCGVQAQLSDGTWTDPVFIMDKVLNDTTRWNTPNISSSLELIIFNEGTVIKDLKALGVRKLRACVVFPDINEREIICQGVLSPTVYFKRDRQERELFNISSWFFRPIVDTKPSKMSVKFGSSIEFNSNEPIKNEIQGDNSESFDNNAYVDENTLTFHSPDLELDTDV